MSYQLTTQSMPGYLHVTVTGKNSAENVVSYLTEVAALSDEQKIQTILIEENLQGPGLNMFDIFKLIKGFKQIPKGIHYIVYVDTNPEHDPGMMDFARELAVRRGLRVRICRTVQEAKGWIEVWAK